MNAKHIIIMLVAMLAIGTLITSMGSLAQHAAQWRARTLASR